ncbi:MAG TPA: YfiR family protein [Bacteroidia bacterium]|jgi:hypothetical protein|nr:YfiR family protein [Bacteroidia bacterium]
MSKRRIITYRVLLAIMAIMLIPRVKVNAQRLNYEIVSMYVYNFTKYIVWPDDKANNDFVVAVYGDSPLTSLLNKYISSKHVGQRSIVVKVIKSLDEASGCSILFVPSDQSSKIKQLSEQLKGKPVLIISEKYGQSKKGASISIFLDEDDDDKTKFDICKTVIVSNGLIISSNLLKLASQVN